jgi:hypothetical protein
VLTWRYSKEFPEGKVFDTEGREAPRPPSELNGWFDTPAKLHITQDELIEAVVKRELASQSSDRTEIEKAVKRKTGKKTHFAAKDETLIKIVDNK